MRTPLHLTFVSCGLGLGVGLLLAGGALADPAVADDAEDAEEGADVWADADWDGVVDGDDDDDADPCVPEKGSSRCDRDGDGVDNGAERGRGTDEFAFDSDGDGVSDFDEGDDDTNDNGVIDALDVCVPVGCSDEDSVVVLDVPVFDGGCAQANSLPSFALVGLLLLTLTSTRRQRSAPARVRLVRWTAPAAGAAPGSASFR